LKTNLVFMKNYQADLDLRRSFNELANRTFGIEFETWYSHGFWTEKYQPYSFVEDGKVVANVSVNLLHLVIHQEMVQAVQIGTVMTDPDYRGQGLSRKLIEKVLEDFQHISLFYLFANQSVLEFYPKFGFIPMDQLQFTMDYLHHSDSSSLTKVRRLDGNNPNDLNFIYQLALKRQPLSQVFATSQSAELLMFYCCYVFPNDLYFLEEEEAVIIYQIEEATLHLFDIVSTRKPSIHEIVGKIANETINKVVVHFHLEDPTLKSEPYQDGSVLFIKNNSHINLAGGIKHPMTSQA
jgi:GNAT superfamily N-acetyltransferase